MQYALHCGQDFTLISTAGGNSVASQVWGCGDLLFSLFGPLVAFPSCAQKSPVSYFRKVVIHHSGMCVIHHYLWKGKEGLLLVVQSFC